ncbi:MAG: transposase [Burkholderia sp.]
MALGKIKALLDEHLETTLPGGKLGQALGYLGNQWPKLCRHIENEAWPICNNACGNSIRPFVLGSKNWLFSDRVAGAKESLNLHSLIETCKANSADVYQPVQGAAARANGRRLRSAAPLEVWQARSQIEDLIVSRSAVSAQGGSRIAYDEGRSV